MAKAKRIVYTIAVSIVLSLFGIVCVYLLAPWLRIHGGEVEVWIKKYYVKIYMGSVYSLGVYLLHEHLDLRTRRCPALINWMKPYLGEGVVIFIARLLLSIVAIFTAGVMIDFIREKLSVSVGKLLNKMKIVEKLYELDKVFF